MYEDQESAWPLIVVIVILTVFSMFVAAVTQGYL